MEQFVEHHQRVKSDSVFPVSVFKDRGSVFDVSGADSIVVISDRGVLIF